MYVTFTRTWWRQNPDWPNGLEPCPGRRHYTGDKYETQAEAREACKEYNEENDAGPLSLKMEYEEE